MQPTAGARVRLRQGKEHRQSVKTVVYTAANTVIDKAHLVAAEDLTAVIKERGGKRIKGPQEKRRLSAWVKTRQASFLHVTFAR